MDALAADLAAGGDYLDSQAAAAEAQLASVHAVADLDMALMTAVLEEVRDEQSAAYDAAVTLAGTLTSNMTALDGEMDSLRSAAQARSDAARSERTDEFDRRRAETVIAMKRGTNDRNDISVPWSVPLWTIGERNGHADCRGAEETEKKELVRRRNCHPCYYSLFFDLPATTASARGQPEGSNWGAILRFLWAF